MLQVATVVGRERFVCNSADRSFMHFLFCRKRVRLLEIKITLYEIKLYRYAPVGYTFTKLRDHFAYLL